MASLPSRLPEQNWTLFAPSALFSGEKVLLRDSSGTIRENVLPSISSACRAIIPERDNAVEIGADQRVRAGAANRGEHMALVPVVGTLGPFRCEFRSDTTSHAT